MERASNKHKLADFGLWFVTIAIVLFVALILSGAPTTGALGGYLGMGAFGEEYSEFGGLSNQEISQTALEVGIAPEQVPFFVEEYRLTQWGRVIQVVLLTGLLKFVLGWVLFNVFNLRVFGKIDAGVN